MSHKTSKLQLWLGVFAGFVVLLVVLQNQVATRLEFLHWSVEASLFMVLNVVLVLVLLGGYLIGRRRR